MSFEASLAVSQWLMSVLVNKSVKYSVSSMDIFQTVASHWKPQSCLQVFFKRQKNKSCGSRSLSFIEPLDGREQWSASMADGRSLIANAADTTKSTIIQVSGLALVQKHGSSTTYYYNTSTVHEIHNTTLDT